MRKDRELSNIEANERRLLQNIKVADLVQVTAFNKDKMTVDVKPLVKREISGAYVSPPPILSVKIAYVPMVAKDVEIKPDIKAGDIGAVVYLDLDSDGAISSGSESQPVSVRLHSGDDAVFVGVIASGL
ncbi:Gp138 family membrane-puncturing spike protein [Lacrimispora sp.]|jgi:hypothetical protein|uniref:Gp138 family membrane-puncturing spike protein n=1 Tax=Lacrimispora sp. TaxID=2719234 RepID=UPI0028B11693|nr:Gp138 family membrane-puncturing spike protein [Lacrimispora sp.]